MQYREMVMNGANYHHFKQTLAGAAKSKIKLTGTEKSYVFVTVEGAYTHVFTCNKIKDSHSNFFLINKFKAKQSKTFHTFSVIH